ncbi:MAG: enoyl-CoA hydratase/isomerase family protein [Firmicutes bacterium]|nr:enoyl-CoA hydratase/isomerase family protein [Bacillota bacterium]
MTDNKPVILSVKDTIATVTLNRPEKANAFDGEMWIALEETANMIKLDPKIKVVILTGSGKSFCGGLDINKALTEGIFLGDRTFRPGFESLQYVSRVFTMFEQLPVPVIAAVNGGCIGLGFELALACDIRLASDDAIFSIPEVTFGLVPDCGGTQRLPRLIGPAMAKELIFTGRRIDAAEALRIKLVNHLYPAGELLDEAENLAAEIAANPVEAVQASKRCLNVSMNSTLETGLQFETASAETVLGEKVKELIHSESAK